MKIVGVIPAHLASIRFPRKSFPFYDLPMIEHVRRKFISESITNVYVATQIKRLLV